MLDFVTFKWQAPPGYRSKFESVHVNVLASMIARNYRKPHRLTCITDDASGIDKSIRIVPLWPEHAKLASIYGAHNPSCYRRLKLFSREASWFIGERFVALDLDVVIVGDLEPLFERPEDFVIWKSVTTQTHYNGSLYMLRAGTREQVWNDFDPLRSPQETRAKKQFGSDQAWISLKLGPREAVWTERDGIYSFRLHMKKQSTGRARDLKPLPDNAKIIVFHGEHDPWDSDCQQVEWIRRNWR